MGLIDTLQYWMSGRASQAGSQPCPREADIINYKENKLPAATRTRLEQHFTSCHDCRELLLLLARFPEAEIKQQPLLSSAEIQQQTAKIILHIEENERHKAAAAGKAVPVPQPGWGFRFRVELAAAAMIVCALTIGGLYWWMHRESPAAAARHSLAMAMKDERRNPMRLSGGFEYSPSAVTRGSNNSPDFYLKLALSQLQSAERDNAPLEMRQMLARAHLAFDRPEDAREAQKILESLLARGAQTAEVFNDLGVAQYQQQVYDKAIDSFSRALELNPAYTEALFNRALAKEGAGRYSEAKHDWQQFVNSTADDEWKAEAKQRIAALSSYSKLLR